MIKGIAEGQAACHGRSPRTLIGVRPVSPVVTDTPALSSAPPYFTRTEPMRAAEPDHTSASKLTAASARSHDSYATIHADSGRSESASVSNGVKQNAPLVNSRVRALTTIWSA